MHRHLVEAGQLHGAGRDLLPKREHVRAGLREVRVDRIYLFDRREQCGGGCLCPRQRSFGGAQLRAQLARIDREQRLTLCHVRPFGIQPFLHDSIHPCANLRGPHRLQSSRYLDNVGDRLGLDRDDTNLGRRLGRSRLRAANKEQRDERWRACEPDRVAWRCGDALREGHGPPPIHVIIHR